MCWVTLRTNSIIALKYITRQSKKTNSKVLSALEAGRQLKFRCSLQVPTTVSVHVKERGVIQATTLGKKLFLSLFVRVLTALYLFPDGRKQSVAGMSWILDNVAGIRMKAAWIDVVQVRELGSHNSLCNLDYLCKISLVLYSAAGIPHYNTMAENAFYYTPVKVHKNLRWYFGFFVLAQEEKPLLSLLH